MANCKSCELIKKSHAKMASTGAKAGADAAIIADNEDNTATVFGRDAAGHAVSLKGLVALAVTSNNTPVLTVDPPVDDTFAFHGVAPGTADISITATWRDGSVGPFSMVLPATVKTGGVTGLTVELGTPVPR